MVLGHRREGPLGAVDPEHAAGGHPPAPPVLGRLGQRTVEDGGLVGHLGPKADGHRDHRQVQRPRQSPGEIPPAVGGEGLAMGSGGDRGVPVARVRHGVSAPGRGGRHRRAAQHRPPRVGRLARGASMRPWFPRSVPTAAAAHRSRRLRLDGRTSPPLARRPLVPASGSTTARPRSWHRRATEAPGPATHDPAHPSMTRPSHP